MRLPPLPLVEKAAGMCIEETLPRVLAGAVDLETMLEFCAAYRRIGICQLLMTGLPDEFFSYLSMSAHAFLFYLHHQKEEVKATGRAEPFLDAMACGDLVGAQALVGVSRRSWNAEVEYEEDFLYFDLLMGLLAASPTPSQQLQSSLARYEELSQGQEELRLALCRALFDRNSNDFEESLEAYIEDKHQQYRKGLTAGQLFPDDAATTEQICIEGIALVWLARHLGMKPRPGQLLMPSPALRFSRARLPPPAAWKQVGSFRELD